MVAELTARPSVRRVTPLLAVADISALARGYEAMGLERVDTDDPDTVGFTAGDTGIILTSTTALRRYWSDALVARLADRFVPYVYVALVDEAVGTLRPGWTVMAEAETDYGTREVIVEGHGQTQILVECIG
jgi:hypothetical protein